MRLSNRNGFALPLAILVIAILTAALAAGFTATNAEIGTNAAQRGTERAFNLAQAGLEQFMAQRTALCARVGSRCMDDPTDALNNGVDSVRVTLPSGFAQVIAQRVRPYKDANTPALYFIRSRGIDTSKLSLSGQGRNVRPERTVGIYASWNTNTIKVLSGWTSLSGLNKKGTAGIISGVDECGKAPTIAGVATPKGDLHVDGTWTGIGNPPADTFKTATDLMANVGIDWDAVKNKNGLPADFVVPPSPFPDLNWFTNNPDAWPIIHVVGNFALPNQGRGMLIVDGDLAINGSDMWDGVILVGGKLTSNGKNTVAGATVSGLNKLLGQTPDTAVVYSDNSDADGTKDFVYSSCKVSQATKGLRSYRTMPNTWMDNVVSW
jgi:hypothetical protein